MRLRSCPERRLSNFEFPQRGDAPATPLSPNDVHLWHGNLRRSRLQGNEYLSLLSPDELERMARFRFEPDRRAFAVARGILRTVIGNYLNIGAAAVCFSYSEHGKPSLDTTQSKSGLQFNLSHTAGYVLIGVCLDRVIGVDVERMRSDFETDELASRFFSAAERRALARISKKPRHEAFFRCWTRKESLLKARGDGLLLPLEDFDVSLGPETTVRLATRPDPAEAHRWLMFNVPVPEGYAAAVTVGC